VGSGGSAGLFAPSVAIGALTGAAVGNLGQHLFPMAGFNASSFALVGMGAFFAGVAKVPIAAMLMVCEMTGSYNLLAPLMLVSVLHLLFARNWGIYDTQVEGLKDSPAHAGEFVVDVLEALKVNDVIDRARPALTVDQNSTLKKALDLVSTASGSYFPVVDSAGLLVGIFSLSDIRRIFLETGVHNLVIVKDFMIDNVATVTPEQNLNEALRKLNEFSIHEIPVVDAANPRRVLTMLTRNNIGAAYHRRLRELKRVN
jgi:CIC family chloride channel protein